MVMPRRPSASLADREKKMRLWGPLTGGEGGLRSVRVQEDSSVERRERRCSFLNAIV
jgi:hypothetical protein